jgi:hypothetical protein
MLKADRERAKSALERAKSHEGLQIRIDLGSIDLSRDEIREMCAFTDHYAHISKAPALKNLPTRLYVKPIQKQDRHQ